MRLILLLLITLMVPQLRAALSVSPIGEQHTLAFAINGIDPIATQEAFFGLGQDSVDSFYRASSYGKTWFTGDVAVVQIEMPGTCDLPAIADRSDAAAVAQGFNLDNYTRRAYVGQLPCSFGGIGSIGWAGTTPGGTTYGKIWLNGLGGEVHEMGHSLGMAHADGPCGNRCDRTDIMGMGVAENNAPHKIELGYLTPAEIVDVTVTGTYTINPQAGQSGGIKVLRIDRGNGYFYYLSYRQPSSLYDSQMNPQYFNGALIHSWSPHDLLTAFQEPTQIIDTTPGSDLGILDILDASLADGRTFYDANLALSVQQLSHNAAGVTLAITFGSPPPPPPPDDTTLPTITLTDPTDGATVSNGVLIAANATDDIGIAQVEFYVDGVLQGSDAMTPYNLTWDSRQAQNGNHLLGVKAFDTSGNTATDTVTVNVQNTCIPKGKSGKCH